MEPTNLLAAVGKRVEAARLARGWSKEQAAREARISSITWKRIEDGLGVQDVKRAAALAVLELDDRGEPVGGAPEDEGYVASPGERQEAGDSDADVLREIRIMRLAVEQLAELPDKVDRLTERVEQLEQPGPKPVGGAGRPA